MSLLSRTELEILATTSEGWHVSVYMPTHRAGQDTQQDPIRLKNLLAEAENELLAAGVRRPEAEEILAPAQELEHDSLFWREQSDGLALFLSEDGTFVYYRVPHAFQELVAVSDHLMLKPLMPLLTGDGRFYVLALAKGGSQLYHGTRDSLSPADLHDAPESIKDLLRFEDPEKHLGFHTKVRAPDSGGARPAAFHGHGANEQDDTELMLRYFRQVDEAVVDLLQDEEAPLVLVAPENWQGLYREATEYRHLLEEGISKNPKALSESEIHQLAWEIVGPRFEREQAEAASLFKQLAGNDDDQAAEDPEEIIGAAQVGRVATLFVRQGFQRWGTLDPETLAVTFHPKPEPGDQDLVNVAAIQTLLNGGTVYVVKPDQVPSGSDMAALLRY